MNLTEKKERMKKTSPIILRNNLSRITIRKFDSPNPFSRHKRGNDSAGRKSKKKDSPWKAQKT